MLKPFQFDELNKQIKINFYYQFQKKGAVEEKYDKRDELFEDTPKLKKNKSLKRKLEIKKNESPEKKTSGIVRGNLPEN